MWLRVVLLISLLLPLSLDAQEGTFDTAVFRLAAKVRKSHAKIVVYEIEAPQQLAWLAKKLRLKLEEALLKQEQTVLTRDLDVLLDELKMQRSALFDGTTMREIGQFAGATAILRGQLLADAGGIELYLRLVDVETGKELAAASGKIPQLAGEQKSPAESPAYRNGHVFRERRDWERAIVAYSQAIAEDGEFASFYLYRGISYFRQKNYDKALGDYNNAIELEPKFASAYNWRGMLFSARKEYQKARSDYDQAILLDPGNGYAYTNLGNLWLRQKKYEDALRYQLRAKECLPEHPIILLNLACVYACSGQADQAVDTLEEALRCGLPRAKICREADLEGLHAHARWQSLITEEKE
jgi:tetratricopeptide (TPR) repeat protein